MLDFLGIGAQKCGTTWIFSQLEKHPQLRFPAGKEIHFWDQHHQRGTAWWIGLFGTEDASVKQGEITPAYALLNAPTIAEIYRLAPRIRLFYSIRNPIARAWSSALMAMTRAEMTLDETSDRWFIDHFNSAGSRHRGDYLRSMETWLSVYPREAFKLIFFDDIVSAPRTVMVELAEHLGIGPGPFLEIGLGDLTTPVFEGAAVDLRPALLDYLRALYTPSIRLLSNSVGRDLNSWIDWNGRR
jgi:hypothetical protein